MGGSGSSSSGDVFDVLDDNFVRGIRDVVPVVGGEQAEGGAGCDWLAVFDAQVTSRQLDRAARLLQSRGAGFYTIGSSGHESNALVAEALRNDDPALLHYRSGGFYVRRAQRAGGDGARDVLLTLVASQDDPGSGGRHKVFGNAALGVIPQTSTIASHLPRAVGTALAVERAASLGVAGAWPGDAVVVCSFGDASANHSTAQGAFNSASWSAYRGLRLPLLWVCEDNGIGISVRTPPGWIEASFAHRPGMRYFAAAGDDPGAAWRTIQEAVSHVRARRRPAFLHLKVARFGGHACSDVETAYRSTAEISADYAADPILATARHLVATGVASPDDLIRRHARIRGEVLTAAESVSHAPRRLTDRDTVTAPLRVANPDRVRGRAGRAADEARRREVFGRRLPEDEEALTLAQTINRTLADAAAVDPRLLVFGEDVGRKGGAYGVTRGLQRALGPARVFDTLLDEQAILGLGLGLGVSGLLPVPEIQYLAYLHNAEDQLRGEGASLAFFSNRTYLNPMVVRVAGYAYQKGFGGHFHNDNGIAVLRDVPGLVVATPSRPETARALLRTCLAAAEEDGKVCVFLEPIALYHERDLHEVGDGGWLSRYSPPGDWDDEHVPIGRGVCHGEGTDLTIVTFGNGVRMSLRVARQLEEAHGSQVRVLDLQWISPLPVDDLLRHARASGRVLVVDETRQSAGVSEGVITALVDHGFDGEVARVAGADSFVPLGDASRLVLVSEDEIRDAALRILKTA